MLTDETIRQIAAEEAHHVCESGAPNAKQHNARVVEQAIRRAVDQITSDEIAELREHIVSIQFQLKTARAQNDEHDQDYLAVWKLIKQPNETVVEAAKRILKTEMGLRASRETLEAKLAAAHREIERFKKIAELVWETRWVTDHGDYQTIVGIVAEMRSGNFKTIDAAIAQKGPQ